MTTVPILSSRPIPLLAEVDLVMVGGTTGAVACALAVAKSGLRVFLVECHNFLGEDICSTLRLIRHPDQTIPLHPLESELFDEKGRTTPARVKGVLSRRLMETRIPILFGTCITDIVRDSQGRLCGVLVANRAGRQAIRARAVVDATDYGWIARRIGCEREPWGGGCVRFERSSIRVSSGGEWAVQTLSFEYPLSDFTPAEIHRAEEEGRRRTPLDGIWRAADRLFCVPPVRVKGRGRPPSPDAPLEEVDPACFQTRDEERLFVLGGCADLPPVVAERLLEPGAAIGPGDRIGGWIATQMRRWPETEAIVQHRVTFPCLWNEGGASERLTVGRSFVSTAPALWSRSTPLEVLGEYDVVVVGAGTAGAAAAIAAARQGVRTLALEYQDGPGGIGTLGLIVKPYHGRCVGFAAEVPFPDHAEWKMAWYREELAKAGGSLWTGWLGCGAWVEGREVTGVLVASPSGRGLIRARVVVDATGSGDLAAHAGAETRFGGLEEGDLALQGVGLASWPPGCDFRNDDCLLVDEWDLRDVARALAGRHAAEGSDFDWTPMIQSRERRRIVGEWTLSYLDTIAGRTYDDSVVLSESDYDSHGYPSSPFFALLPHDDGSRRANHPAPGGCCYTPFRAFLPKGLEGILVGGVGISMDRDVAALMRMQLDLANQGYALGLAGAMAVKRGVPLRRIPVRELQRHLVEKGNLPKEVLEHQDNFPLEEGMIREAVIAYGKARNPAEGGRPLARILTHADMALPFLRTALEQAKEDASLRYAEVLALLGDGSGAPVLREALHGVSEWDPKIFQGKMAEFAYLPTPVDGIILALGWLRDRLAVPEILRMLEMLDANVTLSHHRAVAQALERIGDERAAEPLARLLRKPGMMGFALREPRAAEPLENRVSSLREITLARALFRCGDWEGLGRRILEHYADDLRGLFSCHARNVLESGA